MPTFAPSIHSYGCSSSYAGPGCGCTAISYGDPGGGGSSGSSSSAKTSSGSTLRSGTYSDAEGYSYSVGSGSITIYKKNGSVWKSISPSSSDWDTIVSNLIRDMAAGKLKTGKATPQVSSGGGGGGSSLAVDPGPELAEDPFYKKPWFPVAVVGGVAFVGLLTYALWPSKA